MFTLTDILMDIIASVLHHSSQLLLTIKPITEDWLLKTNSCTQYSKTKRLLVHITAAIGEYMLAYRCLDL